MIPANAICLFKDGNQWCCTWASFVNLMESPAGFGPTTGEAIDDFLRQGQPPQPNPPQPAAEVLRDAERYRWLRSSNLSNRNLQEVIHDDCNPPHNGFKSEDGLDKAIDAAIAAEGKAND